MTDDEPRVWTDLPDGPPVPIGSAPLHPECSASVEDWAWCARGGTCWCETPKAAETKPLPGTLEPWREEGRA